MSVDNNASNVLPTHEFEPCIMYTNTCRFCDRSKDNQIHVVSKDDTT